MPTCASHLRGKDNIFIVYHFRTQGKRTHLLENQVILWENFSCEISYFIKEVIDYVEISHLFENFTKCLKELQTSIV